ncbi:unnamed protein product [Echinostoma caproni]|uniref:Galactosylgalactosylxylosylprotein 3-beta-glucuronosyltransferase n=1 Tax=Echinostoma caproni TaxID=27848 RepID=A0A183B538_9TREM|nr:unnamed protein product [Echinostoma caproni]
MGRDKWATVRKSQPLFNSLSLIPNPLSFPLLPTGKIPSEIFFPSPKLVTNYSTVSLLSKCGVSYTYLHVETPKGIAQRNLGLQWIRQTLVQGKDRGVLYIADDDNTYDLQLFDDVSPTSLLLDDFVVTDLCVCCVTSPENRSRVTQMWTAYKPDRPFPVDMAGFAVNIDLVLKHTHAGFDYNRPRGMQESLFLSELGLKHWSELEPKADGCQQVCDILVWHTRTADPLLATWRRLESQGVLAPPMKDLV